MTWLSFHLVWELSHIKCQINRLKKRKEAETETKGKIECLVSDLYAIVRDPSFESTEIYIYIYWTCNHNHHYQHKQKQKCARDTTGNLFNCEERPREIEKSKITHKIERKREFLLRFNCNFSWNEKKREVKRSSFYM